MQATTPSGSQLFYDQAGSKDKTLKLYDGYFHDLLHDTGKEAVMADIVGWLDARLQATQGTFDRPAKARDERPSERM